QPELAESYAVRARTLAPEDRTARDLERELRAALRPDVATSVDGATDSDDNDFVAQEGRITTSLSANLRGTLHAGWRHGTDPRAGLVDIGRWGRRLVFRRQPPSLGRGRGAGSRGAWTAARTLRAHHGIPSQWWYGLLLTRPLHCGRGPSRIRVATATLGHPRRRRPGDAAGVHRGRSANGVACRCVAVARVGREQRAEPRRIYHQQRGGHHARDRADRGVSLSDSRSAVPP